HLERLGGGVAAAQKPDLARPLFADQPREIGGAPAGVAGAAPRPTLPEYRLLRGDRQVAHRRQHIAAADRIALHLGDHRLPAVADRVVQFLDRPPDETAAALPALPRAPRRRAVAVRFVNSLARPPDEPPPAIPAFRRAAGGARRVVAAGAK